MSGDHFKLKGAVAACVTGAGVSSDLWIEEEDGGMKGTTTCFSPAIEGCLNRFPTFPSEAALL